MSNLVRKSSLAAIGLFCFVPELLAQSVRRLPEGGSDLICIAMAGISCLGAVVYRIRR